jgi:chromosomal replication initiation ATPase DnaA
MPASDLRQLALDLPFSEALAPTDFLVAPSNREAFEGIRRWPDWPAPAFLIVGPEGSGKTHLAGMWARRSGALVLGPASLWEPANPLGRLGQRLAVVIDEADAVADEPQFLHLYNRLQERSGYLLLTASRGVGEWPLALADLRSRLLTAWVARIEPPTDDLRAALLVKHFADRQVRVEPEVISYLLARIERSFAAVRRVTAALDRASLRAQRPVTLALVRAVLQAEASDTAAESLALGIDQDWRTVSWISA